MSSIVTNELRVGRFTSSQVHCLMKKGKSASAIFSKAGLTYIEKKYHERKLNRSLDMAAHSKSMAWGLFLEQYVYSHFTGLRYEIASNQTKANPNVSYHSGSADLLVPNELVSDIKCYEPIKFCKIVECMLKRERVDFAREFPQEYWQLVSNAVINDVPNGESIVYMPTLEELAEIREIAADYDGADQWKYRHIYEAEDYELPHIPKGSQYESLNKFEFPIPQEDKDFLMERLAAAEEVLQQKKFK